MLERNGTLKIANVGDCGLRVIRKGNAKAFQLSNIDLFLVIFYDYCLVTSLDYLMRH